MVMKIPYLLSLLFLCLPLEPHAQVFLGDDADFFNKKARLYQRWLDAKGYGQVLKVDEAKLAKNGMELELWLSLRTTNPDEGAALWNELQQTLAEQEDGESLDETLYYTFVRFMEIPPAQGNIQVYLPATSGGGYNPCFYYWIWEADNAIQHKKRINACKAQTLNIPVELPRVEQAVGTSEVAIDKKRSRQEVFDAVLHYARQRYEQPKEGCDDREPEVEQTDFNNEYVLKFHVSDLCREVLTDEEQSLWCDFVELWWGDCNDMRRERLEFTFHYTPTDDGYLLTGSLTGKFGSGVYKPRSSGYMDMEPDFEDDFLIPYVNRFQQDLKRYLERP